MYRNLVRFCAIRCNMGRACKLPIMSALRLLLRHPASLCKRVDNGLKIRRGQPRGGSTPPSRHQMLIRFNPFKINGLSENRAGRRTAYQVRFELYRKVFGTTPSDGSLGGINQPSQHRTRRVRVRASRSEAPLPPSKPMPISFSDPGRGLVGVAILRPSPE